MPLHIQNSKKKLFALIVVSLFVAIPLLSVRAFTSAASAPAGLPAIDHSNFGGGSGVTSVSTSLNIAQSPEVVIVLATIGTNTPVTASVTDSQHIVTWSNSGQPWADENVTSLSAQLVEFYGTVSVNYAHDYITVSISQAQNIGIKVFGIYDVNTASPFDPNYSNQPAVNSGYSATPSVNVTTANANDMILGMAYFNGGPNITATACTSCQSGFVTVGGSFSADPTAYAQYALTTTTQSNLVVGATLTNNLNMQNPQKFIMIGEAIQGGTSSGSTTTTKTTTSPTTTTTTTSQSTTTTSPTTTSTSSSTTTTTAPTTTPTTTTTSSVLTHGIPSTTTNSQGGSSGPISLTLAAIIAVIIIIVAIGASIFIRRRQ